MGAAGVGKTTILQKLSSEETPIVRNPSGRLVRKLDSSVPTSARGLHDVDFGITYPSQPGFVFHDSRGLEPGSVNELNEIREFLVRRARNKKHAVHVIWYCRSAHICGL
ncbi:hypothetical protein FRB94_008047 [Tulasnella sp. JGI-2019a]|nr:hypothetical protein FRB94_008047 [Tulasnella sp. JGI-2019a]